ncbi:hypothetical protein Cs7R123_72870 [Catellatospora sp. TT07R-123]|uniref:hypothetical protein n=1 Tax=Catellatospora sp. TT07R-123 TaxID=2733863 RepID=UPI001B007931|nr:hypothetical protein [Catellatospora sp. TT07R-123]GHJ49945.1 hypothetical protein Cs7R123_72870 [Catellatospora sp. TT07R-123]
MASQTTPLPGTAPADACDATPAELVAHHRRPAPDDHLCTCGHLRDDCVRDTIRTLWNLPTATR